MEKYSKNPSITEFMEMPCKCDCGNWFDLNDGMTPRGVNKIICEECFENHNEDLETNPY